MVLMAYGKGKTNSVGPEGVKVILGTTREAFALVVVHGEELFLDIFFGAQQQSSPSCEFEMRRQQLCTCSTCIHPAHPVLALLGFLLVQQR